MNTPPDVPDWAACLSLMTRDQLVEVIVRSPIRPSNATLLAAMTDAQVLDLIDRTRGPRIAAQFRMALDKGTVAAGTAH